MKMRIAAWTAGAALGVALVSGAHAKDDGIAAKAAFQALAGLAGTWQGQAGGEPAQVGYRLASGGSVVMETLFPGTDHEMITMYHLDGAELVATHYCAAGNQPRFKLDRKRSTAAKLIFAFAGGSNLNPKRDSHIHGGAIAIQGPDAILAEWDHWQNGALDQKLQFDLQRRRD